MKTIGTEECNDNIDNLSEKKCKLQPQREGVQRQHWQPQREGVECNMDNLNEEEFSMKRENLNKAEAAQRQQRQLRDNQSTAAAQRTAVGNTSSETIN